MKPWVSPSDLAPPTATSSSTPCWTPPPRTCARTSTEPHGGGVARSEFELIGKYFARLGAERADVRIGVGDDGAIVAPPASRELVMVTDSLVDGVHFPAGSPPASIGHRAFAVNLSDIAAMGAEPAW